MRRLSFATLGLCLMLVAATGYAQDLPKAKKMENLTWHQVVMVKYKPGKMSEAKKLINDHFMKAGIEAGTAGPEIMEFKTGEWDMMMVWTMKDLSDMEWEVHPDDEKWWAAMAAQEGGADKAMQVMQQYMNLVDNTTSYLATSFEAAPTQAMGSKQ